MDFVKRINNQKKILFILVGLGLLIMLLIALHYTEKTLVSGNISKKYSDSMDIPAITADNGYLSFNSVSVKVPKEGASYVIGYDWAEGDTEYPTIPSSASASYLNDKGHDSYEILLYRDKVSPKNNPDSNVSLDTWFDGWTTSDEDGSTQEKYKAKNANGILIKTANKDLDGENKYCSYTYYFAVETSSSIEQYILELNCFDTESISNADSLFKSCADSISVNKENPSKKKV